ncbi:MAG: GTPase Era [Acidobacteria bacterium]|nr:MAG: GTPase Era [Acidobacteriota bacterium]
MTKSGFVSIIGRPNSGKSTLLNRLVGEKISIVTDKPQTTRRVLRGILTRPEGQITFLDTPGIHKPIHRMNERMMSSVRGAMADVDLILLIVDASTSFGRGDEFTLDLLKPISTKKILLLNKIDRIQKNQLLPIIDRYSRLGNFEQTIPISALTGENVEEVINEIFKYLSVGPMFYPPDQMTDQPERAIAAEMIREKLIMFTQEEMPYSTAVVIDRFEEGEKIHRIFATIFVERESQKAIVIGKGGQKLKDIGTEARKDLEAFFERKIFLELHVKVRKNWRDDEDTLRALGLVP